MVTLGDLTVLIIIYRFVCENRTYNKTRKAPNKVFNETDDRYIENPKVYFQTETESGGVRQVP